MLTNKIRQESNEFELVLIDNSFYKIFALYMN